MQVKTPKQFGAAIRQARKKSGLTQKKLAALADVGTRFLSELERGKPTSQIGKTLKVCGLVGLEVHVDERR